MNALFEERAQLYFGEKASEFLFLAKQPPTQAFFLNLAKADRDTILSFVDFPYWESPLTKESFYCQSDNIGKSKAYELGLIYPQEIAASLTSAFLKKKDVRLAVDLCAAPGGKSINILNRLNSDALLISNDYSHSRALALSSNLERLGFSNVIVTNKKTDELAKQLEGCADLLILDAPCSGEGMIRKYPQILDTYSLNGILSLAETQKKLLDHAYRILKPGGDLIYSTCTFAFEEDENQISDFLDRYPDMQLQPVFLPSFSRLPGCVKLSFTDHTEGQFFAILHKNGEPSSKQLKALKTSSDRFALNFIRENLLPGDYFLYSNNSRFYLSLEPLPDLRNNVLRYGIYLGDVVKNRFEPAHHFYRSDILKNSFRYVYDLSDAQYDDFISGKEIKADLEDHYYQLLYKGFPIGFGKCSNSTIKNKYPKGLRRMI